MPATDKKAAQESTKRTAASGKKSQAFTHAERAAMAGPDRALGERLHVIIKASAPTPDLPRLRRIQARAASKFLSLVYAARAGS